MNKLFSCHIGTLLLLHVCTVSAVSISSSDLILSLDVDPQGDLCVFCQPIDVQGGYVVSSHVEAPVGADTGYNLRTVIRLGKQSNDGTWLWSTATVEQKTARDPYHTQSSVAFDSKGYIHVAYNMHNAPWQYSVSAAPYSTEQFIFKGQALTDAQYDLLYKYNKTPFPTLGEANIPGNQISYPMFFKDRNGELYTSYRYSVNPASAWDYRRFSLGVAHYDAGTGLWSPIGGAVALSSNQVKIADEEDAVTYPLASQLGYVTYLPVLAFSSDNAMHIYWSWRQGEAGADTTNPSYIYSPNDRSLFYTYDDIPVSLPVQYDSATRLPVEPETKTVNAPKSLIVNADDKLYFIVEPTNSARELVIYNPKTKEWSGPELMPWGAGKMVIDKYGYEWAFASGINVFVRPKNGSSSSWKRVGAISSGLGYQYVLYSSDEDAFYISAKTSDLKKAYLYKVLISR